MFAMESGKRPVNSTHPIKSVRSVAQIAQSKDIDSIYDPTSGSGSLLLTVGRHLDIDKQKTLLLWSRKIPLPITYAA